MMEELENQISLKRRGPVKGVKRGPYKKTLIAMGLYDEFDGIPKIPTRKKPKTVKYANTENARILMRNSKVKLSIGSMKFWTPDMVADAMFLAGIYKKIIVLLIENNQNFWTFRVIHVHNTATNLCRDFSASIGVVNKNSEFDISVKIFDGTF